MKNQTLIAMLLALGVSFALSQSACADFLTAATNTNSLSEQGDLAGDVNAMFSVSQQGASDLFDVYGFCTESPQEGNFQKDPRKLQTPVDYDSVSGDHPVTPAVYQLPPSPREGGRRDRPRKPKDPDDPGDPKIPITPEPVTVLILGLGAAGLLPLSRRVVRKRD